MYTRKLKSLDKLKAMNLSKEDLVIYGSAPMVLRGLKEKNNDLDILVKDNLWEKLKLEYPNNIKGDYLDIDNISFTHTTKGFLDNMDDVIRNSNLIDGYHILSLEETKKWKEKVGGEKHLQDVKIIDDYLSRLEKNI